MKVIIERDYNIREREHTLYATVKIPVEDLEKLPSFMRSEIDSLTGMRESSPAKLLYKLADFIGSMERTAEVEVEVVQGLHGIGDQPRALDLGDE